MTTVNIPLSVFYFLALFLLIRAFLEQQILQTDNSPTCSQYEVTSCLI